jgi:acetylornithine deacetylase/succinyl-diaminopimelate desuccinylase-like protein
LTPIDHVTRAPDGDRDAMQQLLAALVAVPTENPPATGHAPCVELLVSTLAQLGLPYETISIPRLPTHRVREDLCADRRAHARLE